MLIRRRRQLSVLIIPDDGSRTLEFKVSFWLLRGMVGALAVLLALVLAGGVFYWEARSWERRALTLKGANALLQAEVDRVDELAETVGHIKQVDQQLRDMLSATGAAIAPFAYAVSLAPRVDASDVKESQRIATVLGGRTAQRRPMDPRWMPSIWPVPRSVGWVTAEYDDREGLLPNRHLGIDIAAPEGTIVVATADGSVVYAGRDETLGLLVAIDHFGCFMTRYGHNSSLLVSVGDEVRRGQPIGLVGTSGRSSGPHLHYEVREGGRAGDPREYLP
ncbi:MAG: M23 family metallopeptidase [Candidatus Latescibacteria bacterium]|nr:M23 family metallopeptidase [Candidatus Latescibacterota bacterium]